MIIIDQARTDAPPGLYPRSQQWWRRFVPEWVTVTVRADGTVILEPSGLTMRYATGRGVWRKPSAGQSAAACRRRDKALARRIGGIPRLAAAIAGTEAA
jgi:hypothetical protein